MHYLVDGYNLAHWLVRDDDLHPDALRERLLAALRDRMPRDARRVDVYWDVRRPSPAIPPRVDSGWCTQHFVPDADEAIVDAVWAAKAAHRMCVVSRDREVTGKSRQLGAKTMPPAEFLRR